MPASYDATIDWDRCFDEMDDHGLAPMLYHKLKQTGGIADLPTPVEARWRQLYYAALGRDALDRHFLQGLCGKLSDFEVTYALFKGAALGLGEYESGALRPRADTDVLCLPSHWRSAERALHSAGYEAIVSPGTVFLLGQKMFVLRTSLGDHIVDLHSSLSARKGFSRKISPELALERTDVLRIDATKVRVLERPVALLMACLHPLLHHPGDRRLIWEMDMVLLSRHLGEADRTRLIELARLTGCQRAIALSLERAGKSWGTSIDSKLLACLEEGSSDQWLLEPRSWKQNLLLDLRALGFWGRLRLLGEILFPPSDFVLSSYGLTSGPFTRLLVPALLLHRAIRGARRRFS